jgi:hypothetical protein
MGKKPRHKKNQTSSRPVSWHWLAIAGVLLLIVGGAVIWNSSRNRSPVTPQVAGSPKLLVDQTTVDEGYLQYNVPVRTTFRLSNVGDQPLKIVGQPMVELVEGC